MNNQNGKLGKDVKFRLNSLLNKPSEQNDSSIYVTREIERLIASGRYEDAYDLYLDDCIEEVPEDFVEFFETRVEGK